MSLIAVFDLDGTLVDSAPDLHAALDRLMLQRGLPGFIRAEVVPQGALVAAGGMAGARAGGHVRLEGREYIVQDGDVIHFRFNV